MAEEVMRQVFLALEYQRRERKLWLGMSREL
jgi:hypothetical protein